MVNYSGTMIYHHRSNQGGTFSFFLRFFIRFRKKNQRGKLDSKKLGILFQMLKCEECGEVISVVLEDDD